MVPVSEFFPRLLPYVPGCSDPMAAQAVVDSAIALCNNALVLKESMDTVVARRGQRFVEFDLPFRHELARVVTVRRGRQLLSPLVFDQGQAMLGAETTGQPARYYVARAEETASLGVFPLPDQDTPLDITFAVKPTRAATTLHQDLFERWVDAVVEGAIARLCAIPAQPFSDPVRATQAAQRANVMSNHARRESSFNRVRAAETVRLHPFA